MFYQLKGRYGRRAAALETTEWGQLLHDMTQDSAPDNLGKTEQKQYYFKQLPYLFSGELQNNQFKTDAIATRDALMLTLHAHADIESFDALSQRLQSVWGGFEYYLYASGMTYVQGIQGIAIIPLQQATSDADLYQMTASWLYKLLMKAHVIARMPSLMNVWAAAVPVPVQINGSLSKSIDDQTIYHHSAYHKPGQPSPRLDISNKDFKHELLMTEASMVSNPDKIANGDSFDAGQKSIQDTVKDFTAKQAEWLTDEKNTMASLAALKRAELRGQINHDDALEAATILADRNSRLEKQNRASYEQLTIAGTPLQSGSGAEFFLTTEASAQSFDWLEEDDKGRFTVNDRKLAVEIAHETHYIHNNGMRLGSYAAYIYNRWQIVNAQALLKTTVTNKLDAAYPLIKWSTHMRNEVISKIEDLTVPQSSSDPFFTHVCPYLIQFRNGTLDLKTWNFGPNQPKNYLIHQVPFDYDESSNPTTSLTTFQWIKALMDDSETAALHFCAFLGMAFTQRYDRQEFLMLAGEGGNGKSTLLDFIRSLFEDGDAVSFSLHKIADDNNKFAASALLGAHLAITTEAPSGYLRSTKLLKALTGNDNIDMEKKGQDAFTARSYAGIICAANELPTFTDRSQGLERRLVLMPMNRYFDDKTKARFDHDFPLTVREKERPDFIKLCLQLFWKSVLAPAAQKHDYFAFDAKMRKETSEWAKQGDSVQTFLDDWCYVSTDTSVGETKEDLYALYSYSCRTLQGQTPVGSQKFIKRLLKCAGLPKENDARFNMGQLRKRRIRQICFTRETVDRINNNLNIHDRQEPTLPGYTHQHERLFGVECDHTQKP